MERKKDEISRASFGPPRNWRAWWIQTVEAAVVTAVLIAFFALFTNHTPWMAALVWAPLMVLVSAVATAWRLHRAR